MRELIVRQLGLVDYEPTWRRMQQFTAERSDATPDELWWLQHPPVFTVGLNGKPEHLLDTGTIPVVNIDRGGQVTYHGPGQLVGYTLLDIARLKLGVHDLVRSIEQSIIDLLEDQGVSAIARRDAPGVYVDGAKIAALGLRVKRGRTYHGMALNVDMDLAPFARINPCGYEGMKVTQLKDLGVSLPLETVAEQLQAHLCRRLRYNTGHE